jgi:hypothetical protein
VEVAKTPSHMDKRLQHISTGKLLIFQRPPVASLVRQNAVSRLGGEAEDVSMAQRPNGLHFENYGRRLGEVGRLSRNLLYCTDIFTATCTPFNTQRYIEVGATPKNAAETAPLPASATPQ